MTRRSGQSVRPPRIASVTGAVSDLVQRAEAAIRERRLLKTGQTILVAVSGGVDSMVLLEVLRQLAAAHRWRLSVAHFNHRLRGRASDADERLVRATARRLGLPCVVERADVRKMAGEQKLSMEVAARRLRHEFLARAARERGAQAVALAHHADDQVELFFLRLLRGAGSQGLAGMDWSGVSPADPRVPLIRPLLDCSKTRLLAFARAAKIRFREDTTNASLDMLRNRVRHELLPFLRRRYQPALDAVVLRQMAIHRGEAEWMDELTAAWRRRRRPAFESLAPALQRRILQNELIAHGVSPDFELIEKLRTWPARPVTVGPRLAIRHDGLGRLRQMAAPLHQFNDEQCSLNLAGRSGRGAFGGVVWDWRIVPGGKSKPPKFCRGCEWFDADRVGPSAVLRHWRPGDRFQPAGMNRPVKLQDLFTNAKIPRDERRRLVVAATSAGDIWWVEGLRISERFKLTGVTERRLQWRWRTRTRLHGRPWGPSNRRYSPYG